MVLSRCLASNRANPRCSIRWGVFVAGDDIGDGLFLTRIVTHDALQCDTHPGASPRSSDR